MWPSVAKNLQSEFQAVRSKVNLAESFFANGLSFFCFRKKDWVAADEQDF